MKDDNDVLQDSTKHEKERNNEENIKSLDVWHLECWNKQNVNVDVCKVGMFHWLPMPTTST